MRKSKSTNSHAREFITRRELLELLRRAGIEVSESTLRRYQAMELLPPQRRYGRKGRGPGVDWGWPREEAAHLVRLVRLVRMESRSGSTLVQLLVRNPAQAATLQQYLDRECADAYQAGYANGRQDERRERDATVHEPESAGPLWDPEMLNHTEDT